MFQSLYLAAAIFAIAFASESTKVKRSGFYGQDFGQDFAGFSSSGFGYGPQPVVVNKPYVPSTAEIASAIQAAKEASANVHSAQQRVQEAKDDVLHQQHVANSKQTQASLAQQKAEAAAAVAQQESKAAANALVQSQQRLAHAKAEVSELQKVASTKEAQAAAIIQKSAHAAAVEIQRTDDAARKLNAIQHSGTVGLKQVAAGKEATLSATSAAVAASAERGDQGQYAWVAAPKYVQLHPWG